MKKYIPIISIILAVLIVVCGGGYFAYAYFFQPKSEVKSDTQQQANIQKIAADLAKAQATMQSESDKLMILQGQPDPSKTEEDQKNTADAEKSLKVALQDEYTVSVAAIKSTDIFFKNPTSSQPKLNITTDAQTQASLEAERVNLTTLMSEWNKLLINTSDTATLLAQAKVNADAVAAYLASLQTAISNTPTDNSLLAQSLLTSYQSTIDDATSKVGNSIATVTQAEGVLQQAQTDLSVQQSIGDPAKIQAQQDVVFQAKNDVVILQAQLNDAQTSNTTDTSIQPPVNNSQTTSTTSLNQTQTQPPQDPSSQTTINQNTSVQNIPPQTATPTPTPVISPTPTPTPTPRQTPVPSPSNPGKPKLLQY